MANFEEYNTTEVARCVLHWIPVTERLPDKPGMYFVSGGNHSSTEYWICQFVEIGGSHGWINDARRPAVKAWAIPERTIPEWRKR